MHTQSFQITLYTYYTTMRGNKLIFAYINGEYKYVIHM